MPRPPDEEAAETTLIPVSAKVRAIFLYTGDTELADVDVQALREAGYIPLKVANLANVKLLPLTITHQVQGDEIDLVSMCAIRTILAGKGTQAFGMERRCYT